MKKIFLCLYPVREFCYDYDCLLDEDEFDHCYKVLNECIEKRYRENGYQVVFAMYPEKNIFGVIPDATDKIITTDVSFEEATKKDEDKVKYPSEEYLIKQLISLNNQTYPNLKLYIFDDCIKKRCNLDLFEKYITNFSYEVLPYCEENINYMGAFEKLVQRSDGEYIAFCDQDDIWMDDKVEKCVAYMNEKNIDLVVTDKQIIDENDNVTCSSVRKHSNKNYDNWNTYDDITKYNIFVTYAVGMSIIMKASFAKKSLPFSKYTGHDKWVLACTSTEGKVGYLNLPLVQYRRHGKNVSGVLVGIETKEDYINQRIMPDLKMIEDFKQKYPNHKDLNEIEKFANARRTGNIKTLFKLRYLAPDIAKFDIVTALLPKKLFSFMVKIAQKIR